ncbi:MAG TPA: TonB-dependent receptor [Deltaproteobacteria bacterium]|nr:TonB-dependent receptor [Deltaproteobacteria bacterium]
MVPLAKLALLLAWVGPRPDARAQSLADEADVHFSAAVEAYQRRDFIGALEHFMQSNRLSPNRAAAGNVARTYVAMKRYPEAYRWYSVALSLTEDEVAARKLRQTMADIEPYVVLFHLESDPPGATVYVDRRSLGAVATTPATIALPPGSYRFLFELEGHHGFEGETTDYLQVAEVHRLSPVLEEITGTVQISGQEGVRVSLRDEERCVVPCEVVLPIGQHVLQLRREGYRSQPALVEIQEGETIAVRAELEMLSGSVRIDANVPDALITVDGVPQGFTPAIVSPPTGRRVVEVSAEGYEPQTFELDIESESSVDLGTVRLKPLQLISLASRVEEDRFTAPSSISVVTREELERFGYPTITEALRGVRGLTAINADLSSHVMVRGVGTASNRGSQTRVLRDGVALSDQLAGQQYLWSRSRNLEQIEIQRGSGSVLYGSGALTGVIDLKARGRLDTSLAEASLGSFGREGRLHSLLGWAPASGEPVGAWISVGGVHGAGEEVTIPDWPTPSGIPVDRSVEHYAPWRATMVDGRAWAGDLELWASYSRDQLEVTSGSEGSVFEDVRNPDNNPAQLSQLTTQVQYRPSLGEHTELDLSAHYRQRLGSSEALWRRPVASSELLIDVARQTRARWIGGTAQVEAHPTDKLRLIGGTELYRSLELSVEQQNTIRPSDAAALSGFQAIQAVYAAYGLVDYAPASLLKVSAGLRLDSWHEFGLQANPRLTAMLLPSDDDVVKVMVGRAFRAPVVFEQKYFVESISIPALDLEPEFGWSYEVEYAHRVDAWTGLVSAWGARYDHTIVSAFDPEIGLARYTNTGSSRVRGLDAELRRDFLGGWMFSLWGSLQDPVTIDDVGHAEPSREQPHHLGALKLVAPIAGPGLNTALRVVYEGARPQREGTIGEVPAGVLADLVLSGEGRDGIVRWRVGVYNALDVPFTATIANNTPAPTLPQTAGRTFMATVGLQGRPPERAE